MYLSRCDIIIKGKVVERFLNKFAKQPYTGDEMEEPVRKVGACFEL